MTTVKTPHKEYQKYQPRWEKVRKVLDGDVRSMLRDVGASEADAAYASQRQKDYADGAILMNFTLRTLASMTGAVMRKPPELELPSELEYLLTDADGCGVGLLQQASDTLTEIDSIGRGGLLVDAPAVAAANRAQQNAGMLNPRIVFYTAENIISWRKDLIVLREIYERQTGEFEWKDCERYRVLQIVDGNYQQRVMEYDGESLISDEVVTPARGGNRMSYIPFSFVGSRNNDSSVDFVPLDTIADTNVGHYRCSADAHEGSFIGGQPTLAVSPGENMDLNTFAAANPNGIRLGSRVGHNLGAGGRMELVQASANNAPMELMRMLESQALMLGAQLLTPTVQITAESARMQRGADTSVMATIANNVSSAYAKCLEWCADMLGVSSEIVFELNTEFFLQPMTAQDRAQWMADINAGLLPARAYYAAVRAAGITNWTDEQIEEALEAEPPKAAPKMNIDLVGGIPPAPEAE